MNGWGTLTGEASYTLGSMAHSPDEEVKMGAFNRIEYHNEEVDRLLEEGAREIDADKRRALFEEAMEKIMADRAYISIVVLQTVWAGNKDKVVVTPRSDEETLAYFIAPAN
jgi:peptide/nickel transport system substrate-binding protein